MRLTVEELHDIMGGATQLNSSLINSVTKLITVLLDLGRSIGSAIRYGVSKKTC